MTHAGQGCAITTRLLLPRSRYDEGVEAVVGLMSALGYGDPTDPENITGPLISAKQRERVLGYIEKGKAEGAKVALGGGRPAHLPKGFYVEPTVFVDVDPDSTDRAGGDLRPGAGGDPVRGRRRRRAHRQQLDLRPLRRRCSPARSSGPARSPAASAPARCRSTAACTTAPTCPSAATSRAASAARWAWPASRSTSRCKTIAEPALTLSGDRVWISEEQADRPRPAPGAGSRPTPTRSTSTSAG